MASIGTCLLLFHAEAADRTHVAYMPDTTWPINGHPPGSSRSSGHTPVSMPPDHVSTRQQRFTCVRLPGPHLTPLTTPFPRRSPRQSSANAARGGLKPPPAGRLRRAKTFISRTAPFPEAALQPTPFHVQDTRPATKSSSAPSERPPHATDCPSTPTSTPAPTPPASPSPTPSWNACP